jgi:hypothetical protein
MGGTGAAHPTHAGITKGRDVDIDFSLRIVLTDDECKYPAAERNARQRIWCGNDRWCYSRPEVTQVKVPRISDPIGLIRSLASTYTAGGWTHYASRASFVS